MKIILGENRIIRCECGNESELTESMVNMLDTAMKMIVKCEHCGERLEITKEGVDGKE